MNAKKPKRSAEALFTFIYENNLWGNPESVSGRGSTLKNTTAFVEQFKQLLKKLGVRTLLDAACGDFHWMKTIELDLDNYIGVDVVAAIINANKELYENEKRHFFHLDVIKDPLPKVDLILCPDCLAHFSFEDGLATLENVKRSGSTYLLTTSYIDQPQNKDIETGDWRALNLQKAPFNLPEPLVIIEEKSEELYDKERKKSLLLWKLSEL